MITIGLITHTNQIIDRKAKAFYDYFHYFLSKNEFVVVDENASENHLSVLEKIDFRLRSFKIESSSKRVIEYLKNSYFLDTKNDFISRRGNVKKLISNFKTDLQNDLSSIKNIEIARESIKKVVSELNERYDYQNTKYLDFCLDELISYISCVHECEEHEEEIKYYTKIIVAEFLRRNFSSEELTGTNSLFSKLLSKEVNINDKRDNVYSPFPLPKEIHTINETPEDYKATIEKFLENRTLKEQFKGILNYLNNTRYKSKFIVKILNADCVNINITFGNTKIVTKEHLSVNTADWGEYEKQHFEEFVSTKNCVFFEKKLEYKSINDAVAQVIRDAEDTLSYLSYPNQIRGIIDRSEYLYLSNDKLGWRWRRNKLGINQNKKYELDNINLNNLLYSELFELDKLYFRVFTSEKSEDKIFNAWRYIEVLLKGKNGDEKRIKDFGRLLITTEYLFQSELLENLIINLIINNREIVDCKIPYNKLDDVIKDRANRIDVLKQNINSVFVNSLIDKYKRPNIDFGSKREFYTFLISTLYEQRNYVAHRTSICSISIEMFIYQIQILLKRIRHKILDEIKINNDINLAGVLEKLLNKAKVLLNE